MNLDTKCQKLLLKVVLKEPHPYKLLIKHTSMNIFLPTL
jgi:hypothetical protein